MCGENNDFILELRKSDNLEHNISKVSKKMFNPGLSSIKTALRVLEPKEFTLALLGV
jgi:hypothetical protein